MVILLEGNECAGKSTLHSKLKELLPSWYNFINHLDRDSIGHHMWWKKRIDSPFVYVIDRGFVSELIYRPIKNDKIPNISLEEAADLCNERLLIIYCKTNRELDDLAIRGDDYISSHEHPTVGSAYDVIINVLKHFTRSQIITYDWTKDNIEELVENIREFACR